MPRIKLTQTERGRDVSFVCPGCGCIHSLPVDIADRPGRPVWAWDGDVAAPTLSPSILETRGHYVPGESGPEDCWICKRARETGRTSLCGVCHSFVRAGRIEFLNDCTHKLAGQTVDLPEIAE